MKDAPSNFAPEGVVVGEAAVGEDFVGEAVVGEAAVGKDFGDEAVVCEVVVTEVVVTGGAVLVIFAGFDEFVSGFSVELIVVVTMTFADVVLPVVLSVVFLLINEVLETSFEAKKINTTIKIK